MTAGAHAFGLVAAVSPDALTGPALSTLTGWLGVLASHLVIFGLLWAVARGVRKKARAASGPAWLLASIILLALYLLAVVIDLGAGAGAVEAALLGPFTVLSPLLPLHERGLIGLAVYQGLLGVFYLGLVMALWWFLVKGSHLAEVDREQSRAWLYRLAGRRWPEEAAARPTPAFRSWMVPLSWALGATLAIGLIGLATRGGPPTPAGWVVAELFLLGAVVNLRSAGRAEPAAPAGEEGDAEEDAEDAPPPAVDPLPRRVERALEAAGVGVATSFEGGAPLLGGAAPEHATAHLAEAHPTVRAAFGLSGPGRGPWRYQDAAVGAARAGRAVLIEGPRRSGRSTALALVALDMALTRFRPVLVLTATREAALVMTRALDEAVSRGPVPRLIRVVCPVDEAGSVGLGKATIVVLPAGRLATSLTGDRGLERAFVEGVGAVVVDDLDALGPDAATSLRVGLEVLSFDGGAPGGFAVVATCAPGGAGAAAWAGAMVARPMELLATEGAPRPPTHAWALRVAGADRLTAARRALTDAGLSVAVFDAVHGEGGALSVAPWPLAEDTSGVEAWDADVRIVCARRRALTAAAHAYAPVAAEPRARAVVIWPVDEAPGARGSTTEQDSEVRATRVPLVWSGAVLRERLIATLIAHPVEPREWLLRVFGQPTLAALEASAGASLTPGHLTELVGEPPRLVEVPSVTLREPGGAAWAEAWRQPPWSRLAEDPGGGELTRIGAGVAPLLAPARSALVVAGRRYQVSGLAPGGARQARRADGSGATRVRAELTLEILEGHPGRRVRLAPEAPGLELSLGPVQLSGRVLGVETLSSSAEVLALHDLVPPEEVALTTVAATLAAPLGPAGEGGAAAALEIAALATVLAQTHLSEADILALVTPEGLHLVDLAAGGHGAAAWLAEHLLPERRFWRGLLAALATEPTPSWRLLRRDARPEPPAPSPAVLAALLGLG